jgi:4-amino-4-deoxy-L-arabinose transferase-like glycosyltransferase
LGTVWLTFLVGRQLTRRTLVGLLAALMVSISPTNVALSRYIAPDTFVTFFALLTFWASVHVFQQGKTRQYVVGGIACGLVASTKYNGALIVLCLVAAHFLRCGRSGFKDLRLYLTLILSAVTFFATTPFAVLDYPKFLNDFRFEAWHYSTGHHGMEGDTAYWYLSYLWQIEGPVAALATLEMLRGILARSKATLLLAIFPLSYFSFISYFVVRNERTLLPLTPFLFLSAASLLTSGWGWAARQRARQPLPIVAIGAFTLFLLALPLQVTAQGAVRLGTEDSRTTARVWIDENLPHGSHIALEAYGPYVDPRNFSVEGVGRTVDQPLDWYVTRGFDYIIFGQGMFSRYYADPDRYAKQIAQYEEMFRALEPVKVFTDGGYEIRIYRVTRR